MKNQMLIFKNVVFELFDSQLKISFHCITSKLRIYSNFICYFIFYLIWHAPVILPDIASVISSLTRLIHNLFSFHEFAFRFFRSRSRSRLSRSAVLSRMKIDCFSNTISFMISHLQKWKWLKKFHQKLLTVFGLKISFLRFVFDTNNFEWFWTILNQFYYFSTVLCCLEIQITLFEFLCIDSKFKQFNMNSNVFIRSSNSRI